MLALLFLGLISFGIYYWKSVRSEYPLLATSATHPFFPSYHYLVQDDAWTVRAFQPVVVDYVTKDGNNYIVGQYLDYYGRVRTVDLFFSGNTADKKITQVRVIKDSQLSDETVTYDQFKKDNPVGTQIPLFYLAKHATPEQFEKNEPFLDLIDMHLPVYQDSGSFSLTYEPRGSFYIVGIGGDLYEI